jgi:hypothetical protein
MGERDEAILQDDLARVLDMAKRGRMRSCSRRTSSPKCCRDRGFIAIVDAGFVGERQR